MTQLDRKGYAMKDRAQIALGLEDAYLDHIVESVRQAVPAERILLFGSYARGEQTPDSDIDLYVITNGDERPLSAGGRIRRNLLWMAHPRDVICSSQKRYDSLKNDLSAVEHQVEQEGILLYG